MRAYCVYAKPLYTIRRIRLEQPSSVLQAYGILEKEQYITMATTAIAAMRGLLRVAENVSHNQK